MSVRSPAKEPLVQPARTGAGSGRRAAGASLLAATPLGVGLAVILYWSADGGGYATTTWYPGGLLVLAALATVWIAAPERVTALDRRVKWSLGFFAAFTAWSYASVAWADAKGDAWDGANQTLVYLGIFALFASSPLGSRAWALFAGLYGAGVAAVGLFTIERMLHAAAPDGLFLFGRFASPTDYPNATAALCLIPVWPLLRVAADRTLAPLARGPALGLAGMLLELALIPQSRGAVYALPVIGLVYLAIVPGRLRSALMLGILGCTVLAAHGPLLAVFSAPPGDPGYASTLASARTTLLASFAVLAVVGAAVAVADGRLRFSGRVLATLERAGVVALAAALVAGGAYGLVRFGGPVDAAHSAWDSFRQGEPDGESRFVGLGSNRYDLWRVSLDVFRGRPLTGAGVDNFAADYLRHRRSSEEPLYPHSIEMRLLQQTGIVGTLLFAAALAAAVAAALRRLRPGEKETDRALAAALTVGFGYWLLHASVDWLWKFPALTGAAFALLGAALALRGSAAPAPAAERSRGRTAAVGVAVAAVAAALSLGPPWIAARQVDTASSIWQAYPDRAYAQLRAAARLDPVSDSPPLVGALIASRRHDYGRMRTLLRQAIDRNPTSWYSRLELAAAESALGHREAALRQARTAQELNPREDVVASVIRSLQARKPVDPDRLDRIFLERAKDLR